jgi:hypothetical protein
MVVKFPRGVSFLETVLYIALLAIILPAMVVFLLQIEIEHVTFDARTRMEQTAALSFSELQTTLTAAKAITTSTSTLGVNPSVLRFQDASGTTITIDCPSVSVTLPGGTQSVRRLRIQTGNSPAVYLTDSDIDVSNWQVTAVNNSKGLLTGLRFNVSLIMLGVTQGVYRGANFTSDTTISLSPHTIAN